MDHRLKICFITTGDIKTNAASKRALGMANPLTKLGWEVHVIMQDSDENHKKSALECSEKVTFHFFSPSGTYYEIIEKRRLIKQIKPSHVYLCGFVIRNFTPYLGIKKPIVIAEHSELTSSIPLLSGANKLKAKLMEKYSVRYAQYLMCASRYLYRYFANSKNLDNILYFPYAYDPDLYHASNTGNDTLKNKYKGVTVFLYVGSITDNYGLFTMLYACIELKKTNTSFKLLLAGMGKDLQNARNFVIGKGLENHIEILGYVSEEDLIDLFSVTNCFIAPLHDTVQDWARCPSKLFLYLPYQKPVITCKIGEAIELFGDQGLYFEINSPLNLSEKMATVIEGVNYSAVDAKPHSWQARSKQFHDFVLSR